MCSNEHTTETSLLLHIIQCKNRGDQFSRKKAQTFVLLQKTSSNIYLNVHFLEGKKKNYIQVKKKQQQVFLLTTSMMSRFQKICQILNYKIIQNISNIMSLVSQNDTK